MAESMRIKIKGARLSHPYLYVENEFEGKKTGYRATFLLPKNDPQWTRIYKIANDVIAESEVKVQTRYMCIKDGDALEKESDGWVGHGGLSASTKNRPLVLDENMRELAEDKGKVYAGCYVTGIISFYVTKKREIKRLCANLFGVQFVKDGEPFMDSMSKEDVMNMFASDQDVLSSKDKPPQLVATGDVQGGEEQTAPENPSFADENDGMPF